MDLMAARRRLLTMHGELDTSPKILEYDKSYGGNGATRSDPGICVTDKYDLPTVTTEDRYFSVSGGIWACTINYANGAVIDYWGNSFSDPNDNALLAKYGTDQIAFSLVVSKLPDIYVIHKTTGIILFAGKNTIYYGHRNISEIS